MAVMTVMPNASPARASMVLYPSRKPLVIACVVYPAAACCPDVLPSGLMKARRKMMKSMTKNAGLSSLPMVLTMPFS